MAFCLFTYYGAEVTSVTYMKKASHGSNFRAIVQPNG